MIRARVDARNVGERLEEADTLDRVADPVHRVVTRVLPPGPVKDGLHGVWLGHPLHPLLTDLPIGFWTSAFMLDLLGGRRGRPAADALVGMGVAAALPTVAAGVADWSELNRPERRTGVVHAAANATATLLYATSFRARRRGDRARGVLLALAGATAATVGGFLGGHLSYRRAAGVNHAADAPSAPDWSDASAGLPLSYTAITAVDLDGVPLAAAMVAERGPVSLYGRCSHLGGPLHEGDLVDGCVRCPWHGSMFQLTDGTVRRGPATAPQPAYEVRANGERLQVRRRPPP